MNGSIGFMIGFLFGVWVWFMGVIILSVKRGRVFLRRKLKAEDYSEYKRLSDPFEKWFG